MESLVVNMLPVMQNKDPDSRFAGLSLDAYLTAQAAAKAMITEYHASYDVAQLCHFVEKYNPQVPQEHRPFLTIGIAGGAQHASLVHFSAEAHRTSMDPQMQEKAQEAIRALSAWSMGLQEVRSEVLSPVQVHHPTSDPIGIPKEPSTSVLYHLFQPTRAIPVLVEMNQQLNDMSETTVVLQLQSVETRNEPKNLPAEARGTALVTPMMSLPPIRHTAELGYSNQTQTRGIEMDNDIDPPAIMNNIKT